jgi:CheY-like chemotaxis protein
MRVWPEEPARPARVLILTTYDTDRDAVPALEAGATGYLLKDAPRRADPRRPRVRRRDGLQEGPDQLTPVLRSHFRALCDDTI